MDQAIKVAKLVAFSSLAILCLVAAAAIFSLRELPVKVASLLDTTQKTVLLTNKAVNDARLTMDNVNKGAIDERRWLEEGLPQTTRRVNAILDNANGAIVSLKSTTELLGANSETLLTHATAVVDNAGIAIATTSVNLQPVLVTAATMERSADALVGDPAIKASLVNVETSSAHIAIATDEAARILKDGRLVADKYISPQKWYMKALGYLLKGGELTYDFIR
jgi:hypothetical protein